MYNICEAGGCGLQVSYMQRFLVDACVCGGAWVHVPAASSTALGGDEPHLGYVHRFVVAQKSCCARCSSWFHTSLMHQSIAALVDLITWAPKILSRGMAWSPRAEPISSCALEVEAPWRRLQCLSPDATQLADSSWRPQPPPGYKGTPGELF